jgi:phosphatidylglycerophosphate synthase
VGGAARGVIPVVVLALAGAVLVVWAWTTARRPSQEIPSRDGYLGRWQELHGGYDPRTGSRWLLGWLSLVFFLARPLARRGVHPDVLTVWSLWVSALVVVVADAGGRWLLLAAWVLAASGLLDNLDGCVAVLQRRTTRWGYVLDSVVDRTSDGLYLVAMVLVGVPIELAVLCGFLFFLLEYVRARAGNAGGDEVGRITMAERPTRVIVLAVTLLAAGAVVSSASTIVTAGTAVVTGMTLLAVVQLLVVVRRQLLALPPD